MGVFKKKHADRENFLSMLFIKRHKTLECSFGEKLYKKIQESLKNSFGH
jgi:hypothetical protein